MTDIEEVVEPTEEEKTVAPDCAGADEDDDLTDLDVEDEK